MTTDHLVPELAEVAWLDDVVRRFEEYVRAGEQGGRRLPLYSLRPCAGFVSVELSRAVTGEEFERYVLVQCGRRGALYATLPRTTLVADFLLAERSRRVG